MRRWGLIVLVRITKEKVYIWRGLAIILAKIEPYAWLPKTLVADLRAHAAGLAADVRSLQARIDRGD